MKNLPPPKTAYRYLVHKETGAILLRSTRSLRLRNSELEEVVDSNVKADPGVHLWNKKEEKFVRIPKEEQLRKQKVGKKDTIPAELDKFRAAFEALDPALRSVLLEIIRLPDQELIEVATLAHQEALEKEERAKKKAGTKKAPTKKSQKKAQA